MPHRVALSSRSEELELLVGELHPLKVRWIEVRGVLALRGTGRAVVRDPDPEVFLGDCERPTVGHPDLSRRCEPVVLLQGVEETVAAPLNLPGEGLLIRMLVEERLRVSPDVPHTDSVAHVRVAKAIDSELLVLVNEDGGSAAEGLGIGDALVPKVELIFPEDVVLFLSPAREEPSRLYSAAGAKKGERSIPAPMGSRYSFVQAAFSVRQIVSR